MHDCGAELVSLMSQINQAAIVHTSIIFLWVLYIYIYIYIQDSYWVCCEAVNTGCVYLLLVKETNMLNVMIYCGQLQLDLGLLKLLVLGCRDSS